MSGNENVLRFDVNYPFSSLDPSTGDSGANNIFPLLYSYLLVPSGNGVFEPDLAVKWDYDPKKFSWTIRLRENVFFHNGQPVTSKDVKFSYEHVLKRIHPGVYTKIKRIELLSVTSIIIELLQNDPDFLFKIWDIEIVPCNSSVNSNPSNHPNGSGPFKFEVQNMDQTVVLEANDHYYGGQPSLDQVIIYYQPDKEKSWSRILSNKTDIVQEIVPYNFEISKQQYCDRYFFHKYILSYYTILLFNNLDPLFSDVKVRTALTHAINREYIVERILKGFGEVANGPMGVNSPYHYPEIKPVPYNPEKSIDLLRKGGWVYNDESCCLKNGNKCFEFTILIIKERQIDKATAEYISLCLNEIGIKADIESLPFIEFKERFVGNKTFQAVLSEFIGTYRNPEALKRIWSTELPDKSNHITFEHPDVKRMIDIALSENNPLKQKKLLYEIESKIISIQPGTWLFQKSALDIMSRRFVLNSPFPFSLDQKGLCRLKSVSLRQN